MTASWSGPRWGQPNTRSRRDPSRAWRAPLGSLLFAVLDVTDGGSRTVPLPSQPQPHPPSSRRATPLPLAPRAPTARSLTPCSAPSRRGLATPTTPDPRRDGQPRPRRRAASSQSCRSGQRNGAQVEQRNNLGPHYKSPLTGNRPIQAITISFEVTCKRPTSRSARARPRLEPEGQILHIVSLPGCALHRADQEAGGALCPSRARYARKSPRP